MIFISSFKIINGVILDLKIFCIAASVADAATVNPNGIKKLFANGLSTFRNKSKSLFSNGPRSLPRNPPDCTILEN